MSCSRIGRVQAAWGSPTLVVVSDGRGDLRSSRRHASARRAARGSGARRRNQWCSARASVEGRGAPMGFRREWPPTAASVDRSWTWAGQSMVSSPVPEGTAGLRSG
ncbi:vegetative cell wall protein gp1-like [Iris pallida]|uniref:Cytochrome P450 superfamily protein isoform X4 n=1 Tax=Iris pallida TaxID=29817 RepID=A0AAX6E482_IRIPA|nr:vegetative cell wall protein gp1-like [Iris pallida]KAJ6798801.1 putative cytochrome P450 superfamily protein isoform X4 [Iris pallida]KAJ6799176.1 vegetative cell wall protein gp1-like [Iris pallida]KAJ6800961.1 vegetative cell wall protein gp1-like [Iris pallida]KAJ6818248.1 vegetative cell wall protein gp1-like [Iris pallida]